MAIAVGAEGVHIGQDDMSILHSEAVLLYHHTDRILDLKSARDMIGPDAIIGVTCSNIYEAELAVSGSADYLGIGTIFATPTYFIPRAFMT